jgi:diguanylate cyclase (GGDEF)-like protein
MRRRVMSEAPQADPETGMLRARLAEAQARIERLEGERATAAETDARTGLLTLEAFLAAAGRELERARRSGAPVSLVVIDIDGFRELNATQGATGGDAALAAVAGQLREAADGGDVLGRTGADEFAVLLPGTSLEGAVARARQAVDLVSAIDIPGVGGVTVSAGTALYSRGATVELLLGRAAHGLDGARRAGGGRAESGLQLVEPGDAVRLPKNAQADVIEALAQTLLERDRCTGEHSRSVVDMARGVAAALGLHEADVDRVGAAALLHDIGKVAVPDHILHKPAKLEPAEWALMREQSLVGERILRAIPGLAGVARMVRHEHEYFDGSGYPDGLAGEEIPLGSRIVLACDTYHAMTSDRPYRARLTHAEAIHELARCAGTQFDPRVTEALIGHLHGLRQIGSPLVA